MTFPKMEPECFIDTYMLELLFLEPKDLLCFYHDCKMAEEI